MNTAHHLVMPGLNGSNPLGFLAALGTLRIATAAFPDHTVRMAWHQDEHWIPTISFGELVDQSRFVHGLADFMREAANRPEFTALGDDLSISGAAFRCFAKDAAANASRTDRTTADFAAAFGCETTLLENGNIQDTSFRTMAGAGHQHFLGSMRNIINATTADHISKTLFKTWRYDDPLQALSLRWDPGDDIRYALQWQNPSGDSTRRLTGSMLGANRLAIEGLPLFPTAPRGDRLTTTGFQGSRSTDTFWTWPIWVAPLPLDTVRSVLAIDELQREIPIRSRLLEMGVAEIYRSQRLTIGKVRNFTPGRSV